MIPLSMTPLYLEAMFPEDMIPRWTDVVVIYAVTAGPHADMVAPELLRVETSEHGIEGYSTIFRPVLRENCKNLVWKGAERFSYTGG